MQVASNSSLNYLKNDIFNLLGDRKNLMFYDGLKDGLEPNVCFKFFYSSPHDALEFINFDIYTKPERVQVGNKNVEAFGSISIITDRRGATLEFHENIFGHYVVDNIVIRDVKKSNVKLFISKNGLINIENLINFFESSIL